MQLLCYPRSHVSTHLERNRSGDSASATINDSVPRNEWPDKSLYVDINDGRKEWPYWTLVSSSCAIHRGKLCRTLTEDMNHLFLYGDCGQPAAHEPLDLTTYIIPGRNTLRLIQMDDLSEFVFVVYAFEPSEREKTMALERRKKNYSHESIADRLMKGRKATTNTTRSLSRVLNGMPSVLDGG